MKQLKHKASNPYLTTDVLIVGTGIAGLLCAIKLLARGASIFLASKKELMESNTSYAQGGIAACLSLNNNDSIDSHLQDTIASGAGLVDTFAAQNIISAGDSLIHELENLDVVFNHDSPGVHSLAREGGHSRARVIHFNDTTGRSVSTGLMMHLLAMAASPKYRERLVIAENAVLTGLIVEDMHCFGARFIYNNEQIAIRAGHTVLATGGIGQVYARTTNPEIATGDGIACAYRAGATLIDMELVQFHPTALNLPGAPTFLISEAVRGKGSKLIDDQGYQFMKDFHPDKELATRDVVSRAIHTTLKSGRQVFIDLRPMGEKAIQEHFPNILNTCKSYGIDALKQAIPVSPAAHYFMGGIMADQFGKTTISNLYAIGECASTGLHGANRLASNSLLEAGVMALKLANHLTIDSNTPIKNSLQNSNSFKPLISSIDINRLKETMSDDVGIIRTYEGLNQALSLINSNAKNIPVSNEQQLSSANIELIASLIINSAILRKESRGAHFRQDFPQIDNTKFAKRLAVNSKGIAWLPVENAHQHFLMTNQNSLVTSIY